MFRNKTKITSVFTINLLLSLPWAVIGVLLTLYGILLFVGYAEPDEASDYGMAVVMVTVTWFCFWIFFKRVILTRRANRIGQHFENYEDGLVPIQEAAANMKMKQDRFFALFLECLGKGLLKNCSVFTEDPTFILLENGGKTIAEKFAIIHCSQCAAPNAIRIGFENKCKYCGSIIEWKE